MDKHKIMVVRFKNTITYEEVSMFRGAVISTMQNANILFHNHENDKLRYTYPLIQYRRINKCASIVCVDEGVEAFWSFFTNPVFDIQIGNRMVHLEINSIKVNQTIVQVRNNMFSYRISGWLPFNQENYHKYSKLESLVEKYSMLENILTGNILSFAKGIGIHVEQQVVCKITEIIDTYITEYKGVKMSTFDVEFKSNMSIPSFVGLGKGVSLGHGTVIRKRKV